MYKRYFTSGLIIGGTCIFLLTTYHINSNFLLIPKVELLENIGGFTK
jgi:hypothetical protein